MTDAVIGHGVQFKTGDAASPEVFTAVAEVTSVSGPTLARDPVEATHTDSTEAWREFIAGLKDGGEVTITMNFLAGNATQNNSGLLGDFNSQAAQNYRITWPSSPTVDWTFAAILTGFEPDAPIDDRMTASATFKITGKPTLA